MKKIIILMLMNLVFANNINFINPFESNISSQNNLLMKNVNKTIKNDVNNTNINITQNKQETNISKITYINTPDKNITDTNVSQKIKLMEINVSKETNATEESNKSIIQTEKFKDTFKSLKPNIKLAIVIDKKFFKKYLPSIINSVNAYFLYKNVNYTIQVFDENNLTNALNYPYIMFYAINPNMVYALNNFKNNFYLPIINKDDVKTNSLNIYFGGIDYKNQIKKLSSFLQIPSHVVIINSNTYISDKLFHLEKKEFNATVMHYTNINYPDLNNSYIFFNTAASKTAQILSNINYKNIQPNLEFSAQINYDPLLIEITQPQDVEKLIIANSILNVPDILEDYNQLLNSDIEFNWLNYSSTLLANKIYNQSTNTNEFYLNDFRLYIFNNQINYKTKLYQIVNNSFRAIY